ncbi:MAG TPA: PAS domain S-box protein [Candidatus Limnocylindrales bacterium]|nr:PAS domain S-box protein [Candidatus Limnocylindrales bacterium]
MRKALTDERRRPRPPAEDPSFRALAAAATDPIVTADSAGVITYVNPAMERAFGYAAPELLGRPLTLLMPERFREAHGRGLARYLETGEPRVIGSTVELAALRRDGTEFPVELSLGSWVEGAAVGFVGILRDVTERARMRDELLRQTTLLDAVLTSVEEGVIAADPAGNFLVWNSAAERIVGRGPADVSPNKWQEHFGVFRDDGVTPYPADELPLARAIRGEAVDEDVQYIVRPAPHDGAWVSVTGRPLIDGEGRHIGGVVTLEDVTEKRFGQQEIRRLSDELRQQLERLEEANAELKAFSYTVAHDLRAPLRAIQGFAQALREDHIEHLDEEALDYTSRMSAAAARMDRLIQDLLEYSRLTQSELELAPVELDRAVSDALEQVDARIRESGAALDIPSGLPVAIAHERTLVQVFANLLANGLTFVAEGVRPSLRVSHEGGNGTVRVWVEDDGIGISAEHQERIFRVFERLHGTESYPGTGIGLAIVRKAMERMGGRAGVESTVAQGSRFWIELAAAEGPE